jgi:hypothetical protein
MLSVDVAHLAHHARSAACMRPRRAQQVASSSRRVRVQRLRQVVLGDAPGAAHGLVQRRA